MRLRSAPRQMTKQLELPLEGRGEAPRIQRSGEALTATQGNERSGTDGVLLMERVVERSNVEDAIKRVRKNKGSPGIDGMTVQELSPYLEANWQDIRTQLLQGIYQPKPVRKQEIPKSTGGVRQLGIPKYPSNCTWFQYALGKC